MPQLGPKDDVLFAPREPKKPLPIGNYSCHIKRLKPTDYKQQPSITGIQIKKGENAGRYADILKFEMEVDQEKHSEFEGRSLFADIFVMQGCKDYEQFKKENTKWINFLRTSGYKMDEKNGQFEYPEGYDEVNPKDFYGLPIICEVSIRTYQDSMGEARATNDVRRFQDYHDANPYKPFYEKDEQTSDLEEMATEEDLPW